MYKLKFEDASRLMHAELEKPEPDIKVLQQLLAVLDYEFEELACEAMGEDR